MFWKFAFVLVALIAVMVVARDQNWAGRVGVTGSCTQTQPPSYGGQDTWYACKQGILTGFPSLEGDRPLEVSRGSMRERCPDGELPTVVGALHQPSSTALKVRLRSVRSSTSA
jgi:hypothetical protein